MVFAWNAFVWIVLLIPFVVFLFILAFGDVYVFDTFIEVSSVRDRIRPIRVHSGSIVWAIFPDKP